MSRFSSTTTSSPLGTTPPPPRPAPAPDHAAILPAPDNPPAATHDAEIVLRLRESAEHFFGISSALIPETSLIREFMKP